MSHIYCSLKAASLAVTLLLCSSSVSGRVYQTEDAIIIEDVEYLARIRANQLTNDDVNVKLPYPLLFGELTEFLPYPARNSTDSPRNTHVMATSMCFTMEGNFGSCISIRACYPNFESEVHLLTWIIGTHSTCSYADKDGKQAQGVCCSMLTIDDNDAVTGSGRRTISVVTADRYDSLAPPNLALYNYYPYWRVVVPNNLMATRKSIPVSVVASGQDDSKQSSCGAGPAKTLSIDGQRIVGGNKAIKNSWPCVVAVKFNGRFLCGGSLISRNKILTAAHCVNIWFMLFLGSLTVDLGVHTVSPTSDAQETRRVIRIIRHNRFDRNTFRNDIAILTLDSPVTFTSTISPVCLPPAGSTDEYVNQTATIIGWGSTQPGGKMSPDLRQADVQIVPNSQCRKQFANVTEIVDLMLCASASGIDSCQGDSGGPLLVQSAPESPWTQAAIVSFGIGCADPRYPGVYTRVTSHLRWIQKYM